jgi:cytochrome c553
MLNSSRWASAALSLLAFVVLAAYAPPSVNSDTPATHGSSPFSPVITSLSGQEMYTTYCAVCHGEDGRGKPTFAEYSNVPPADLSQLARNNHGIFPSRQVAQTLHYGTGKTPEGQGYNSVWEPLLKSMNADPPGTTEVRIYNLTEYVHTLQAKPAAPRKRPFTLQ